MNNRNVFVNALWMIFDKSFILLGGLITTLIVARYLSPSDMGLINYAILISGFCTVISQWGGTFIIFEAATKDAELANNYVEKTIIVRVILYCLVWGAFSLYLYLNESKEDFVFVSVLSLSMLFLGLDVYQYFFDGQLNSRLNSYATFSGRLFSIITRLLLVYFNADLWCFLIPLASEGLIILSIKMFCYRKLKSEQYPKVASSKINVDYLRSGLPIVVFSFLSLFYDKMNLFLIKEYMAFSDVAIFTMAKTLAMAWTFLPMSFSTSIITRELKDLDGKYLAKSYKSILLVSIIPLLTTYFFSEDVIRYTLGSEYDEAASYLFWLCLLAMFSCFNITTNRVIASMGKIGKRHLIKKSIILSAISIAIGIKLVDKYGILGAIGSSSIIMFIDLFILNIFFNYRYFKNVYAYTVKFRY